MDYYNLAVHSNNLKYEAILIAVEQQHNFGYSTMYLRIHNSNMHQ